MVSAVRQRRVVALGATMTAAIFLILLLVMLNTFWRIGLGPRSIFYEDRVTTVAWVISMVFGEGRSHL